MLGESRLLGVMSGLISTLETSYHMTIDPETVNQVLSSLSSFLHFFLFFFPAQATQLSTTFRGPVLFPCRLPSCQYGVSGLPLAWVSCFGGLPHHGLDSFAHIIATPSLQLDSTSSVQCLAVDFCICFCQFLDKDSMVTVNLLIGEGQLRHPLCYGSDT